MAYVSIENRGIRRWPRTARDARVHAMLVAVVLWIAAIVTFAAGPGTRSIAGPLKGADFVHFYTIGSMARTHRADSLYDFAALHRAQVALVPESDPELYVPVYPPQTALLFAPFSILPFAYATALWSLMTLIAFGLIVRSAWRPVASSLHDRHFVFAAAAAFPPFWSLILHGQTTIIVLAAFWAGWLALERQRSFAAGLVFGLLLIKPQFAIPIAVIVVVYRQWSMLLGAMASVAVQIGAVAVLLGWPVVKAYAAFVPVILRQADLLEPKPFQLHSLHALTRLMPAWLDVPLWGILSVIVLTIAVRSWHTSAPLRVRLGIVILASVLVNPHVTIYDATVLALPLIWLGAHVQESYRAADASRFWVGVYWLFVLLLAPSAAVIGVQLSVVILAWLFVAIARTVLQDEPAAPVIELCPQNG